jgi:non-specific serine/threonine protein kinase
LLTLTGTGGCGKTRLALEVASEILADYRDGIWLVELAPLLDPSIIPHAVASVLNVQGGSSRSMIDTLKVVLKSKQMLLVLDNCEHLIRACGEFTEELLHSCESLKILATSREPLHVRGEQEFFVPPMTAPANTGKSASGDIGFAKFQGQTFEQLKKYDAARLFVERAAAVRPGFKLTKENAPVVAEICHRLDGLPLAIELAVAQIRLLTPNKMLERMERRLPILTRGARDLPERQRTLRSAIAWSYDLLGREEKNLFGRLSVFSGGWTLEAAEEVCIKPEDMSLGVLEGLYSLAAKSLLHWEELNGEPRFSMLETVREYALERLANSGQEGAVRANHAEFFMRLAEQADLHGFEQWTWIRKLKIEHNNMRAALKWLFGGEDTDVGLRLAAALGEYWSLCGYYNEGRAWMEKALSVGSCASKSVWANALCGAGVLASLQGDLGQGLKLLEESLDLRKKIGDPRGIWDSLFWLGDSATQGGDYESASDHYEESLILAREMKDRYCTARSLSELGRTKHMKGDFEQAADLLKDGLILFRTVGEKLCLAWTLRYLGRLAHDQGDYTKAVDLLEQSLALNREMTGNSINVAITLRYMAHTESERGNFSRANLLIKEALAIMRDIGAIRGFARCLEVFAVIALAQDRMEQAVRYFGAAEALRESIDVSLVPYDRVWHDRGVDAARSELGEERFAAVWAEGRSMSMEQAIECALVK